jgi:hypothetical protein
MACHLPNRMALSCISVDCPGQNGEPRRYDTDIVDSEVTELEGRR